MSLSSDHPVEATHARRSTLAAASGERASGGRVVRDTLGLSSTDGPAPTGDPSDSTPVRSATPFRDAQPDRYEPTDASRQSIDDQIQRDAQLAQASLSRAARADALRARQARAVRDADAELRWERADRAIRENAEVVLENLQRGLPIVSAPGLLPPVQHSPEPDRAEATPIRRLGRQQRFQRDPR